MTTTTLVTGGAGFIGSNLADRLLSAGERVRILDDLSRPQVERNLAWLRGKHGEIDFVRADVRDAAAVKAAMEGVGHVFHLAAQVAVTTSLLDPIADFDVNARGTLVLLEAMRSMMRPPSLLFTSTNKVYGPCTDLPLAMRDTRYVPVDDRVRDAGVSEARPLEFHSPYGCAKGTADQYVLDYARTYGLRTCVFRMSCIYGPHQYGNEDQGWVAHFVARAAAGDTITVYGDGRQLRDVLFVDDLIDAMLLARGAISVVSGLAFNVGGGPANALSLLELIARLETSLLRRSVEVRFAPWRVADQRWYVSDVRRLERAVGWRPRVSPDEGLPRLLAWAASTDAFPPAPTIPPIPAVVTVGKPSAPQAANGGMAATGEEAGAVATGERTP